MANTIININNKKAESENKTDRSIYFSDISLISKYQKTQHSDKSNSFIVTKNVNVEAVKNSLKNIFAWIPGERILDPMFGSRIREFLYQGITKTNIEQIIAEINRSVATYEPRVNITNIENISTYDDHEQNLIRLNVIYRVYGLNNEEFNLVYTQRITDY